MSCRDIIKSCELNILLTPTCLKGKCRKQICEFLEDGSKKSHYLMEKFKDFYHRMKLAKWYTSERNVIAPPK